jgi:hypothetical protein
VCLHGVVRDNFMFHILVRKSIHYRNLLFCVGYAVTNFKELYVAACCVCVCVRALYCTVLYCTG